MKKSKKRSYLLKKTLVYTVICSIGLLLGACGGSSTGANGGNGGNGNGNGNGGNEIGTEPTFANVQQIFEQSCSGSNCHINNRRSGVQLDSYQNVKESVGNQYGDDPKYGEFIVQPGSADSSAIVDKIEPDPEIGSRMPETGDYLSDERINQIREWINNGAQDN